MLTVRSQRCIVRQGLVTLVRHGCLYRFQRFNSFACIAFGGGSYYIGFACPYVCINTTASRFDVRLDARFECSRFAIAFSGISRARFAHIPGSTGSPFISSDITVTAVPRQALNFQTRSLIFYKSLSLKGHRLVLMLPRLQASRWFSSRLLLTNVSCPKCYVLRKSNTSPFPGTPFLFTNNYPVAGPSGLTPGSRFPGHFFLLSRLLHASRGYSPSPFFRLRPGSSPVAPKSVAAIVGKLQRTASRTARIRIPNYFILRIKPRRGRTTHSRCPRLISLSDRAVSGR